MDLFRLSHAVSWTKVGAIVQRTLSFRETMDLPQAVTQGLDVVARELSADVPNPEQ